MTYYDVEIPDSIGFGLLASVEYPTVVVETVNGKQARIGRWASGRRRYQLNYDLKNIASLASQLSFFESKRGPVNSFKFKDWTDFTTAPDHISAPTGLDQLIGTGNGASGQTFELVKHYVSGTNVTTRRLCKIVSGSTRVMVDGVDKTANCSIDLLTGVVTFSTFTPANGAIISAGCEFRVQVRFADEDLRVDLPSFAAKKITSIALIEESEVVESFDLPDHPGCTNSITVNKNYEATMAGPRALCIASVANPGRIILPDPSTVPLGGPHFFLSNVGANPINVVSRPGLGTIRSLTSGGSLTTTVLPVDAGGRDVSYNETTPTAGLLGGNNPVYLGFNVGTNYAACLAFQDTVPAGSLTPAVRLRWYWHLPNTVSGTPEVFELRIFDLDNCGSFAQSGSVAFPIGASWSASFGDITLPTTGVVANTAFTLSDLCIKAAYDAWRARPGWALGNYFGIKLVKKVSVNPGRQYYLKSFEQGAAGGHPEWAPQLEVDWSPPGGGSLTCFTIESETGSDAANVGTRLWRLVA